MKLILHTHIMMKMHYKNQSNLRSIQNVNNTLFAGSYFGYGFHEDGIKSSIEMLKTIND
jgi:predicted NAD/FAD-binding protein